MSPKKITYPFTHWVLKAPGVRTKSADTMADRDALIRRFTVDEAKPVHVLEYRTETAESRTVFVRKWTVPARPKRGK